MKGDIYQQYYDVEMGMKNRYKDMTKDEKLEARDRMAELEDKTKKLKTKVLQKRV